MIHMLKYLECVRYDSVTLGSNSDFSGSCSWVWTQYPSGKLWPRWCDAAPPQWRRFNPWEIAESHIGLPNDSEAGKRFTWYFLFGYSTSSKLSIVYIYIII